MNGSKNKSEVIQKIIHVDGRTGLNVYRPSSIRPAKGDATRWLMFNEHLFPIEDERAFMLKLAATWIAGPERRPKIAALLMSRMQGTGKSTWAKIIAWIIGLHNGDIDAFEIGDPGVEVIEPGTPFYISRGAAEAILSRCEGEILRGPVN